MRKYISKTLVITFVIGSIAVFIFGMAATGAWFTDAEEAASGDITTGDFDLTVTGGDFSISNLEPGGEYQKMGRLCIVNDGDYDMKFRGYMTSVVDPNNLRDYLKIKLQLLGPGDVWDITYGFNTTIAEDIDFTDLMTWNSYIHLESTDADSPRAFEPGEKQCIDVYGKLSSAADNDQLNATLTSTLHIDATQWINTGW